MHDISIAAFDAAADAFAYVDSGEPWQVQKLYYSVFPIVRLQMLHEELLARGEESPFPDDIMQVPHNDDEVTTRFDITGFEDVSRQALLAHETQIDPNSAMWFGIMPEIEKRLGHFDEYVLARSLVNSDEAKGDLFDGIS